MECVIDRTMLSVNNVKILSLHLLTIYYSVDLLSDFSIFIWEKELLFDDDMDYYYNYYKFIYYYYY